MVTNRTSHNVKFVDYTGRYPNLCSGVLTLNINGRIVKFGHEYTDWDWETGHYTDNNYNSFWTSGGSCGFSHDYSEEFVNHDEWEINEAELPECYRQYVDEIDKVFNDNVPHGCCGGCL